jgi:DNA processing protein
MSELRHLINLSMVQGAGSQRIRRLIQRFQSAEAVLRSSERDLCDVEGIDTGTARNIVKSADDSKADEQLRLCQKSGVHIVHYWDASYPELLKKIYDPPILLYVKGALPVKNEKTLAVVGMRKASHYGNSVAEKLSKEMAEHGITVVSGLARGIDSWAHRGALKGGGRTVAVFGCGLDTVYPPENGVLAGDIAQCGALISEFPMNTEPLAGHFPRRNRIISGLSSGTVVVEAGERSGALITAFMALDQGREVFAVPGSVQSYRSKGTHRLIREGAKLVENLDDVLAEFPLWINREAKEKKQENILQRLSAKEKILWETLSEDPIHIDQLAQNANLNTSEALAQLLSMELKDCVKQLSGMMFVRHLV